MMMQNKEKKTTTINIDKINGIEDENEIDGYVITDEVKERFSYVNSELFKKVASIGKTSIGIAKAIEGFTSPIQGVGASLSSLLAESGLSRAITMQSIGTQIGIGTWFTPEMHEAMRLFGERMREKQAIEVDRYNNKTHLGMSKNHYYDYLLSTKNEKSDFFHFVIHSFDREDERWHLSVLGFIDSITDREWQDWGKKYYILQDKISNDGVEDFKKQLSTPAPKEIEQGKINEREPYKSQEDMMKELDKFKQAVLVICANIKGLLNNQIPTIAKIKNDALSSSGLTARQVDRYIKVSTILIKTELETETTTGHIRQIVRQFFKGNNVILRRLKVTV